MVVLLSAGYISKDHLANMNIITTMAKELKKLGHKCYITGMSYEDCEKVILEDDIEMYSLGISKIFAKALLSLKNYYKLGKTKEQFSRRHPLQAAIIVACRSRFIRKFEAKVYNNLMQNFIKDKKIDAVVMFSYPFEMAECINLENFKGKKVHFQLDPFSLHVGHRNSDYDKNLKSESVFMQSMDAILTTKLLYNQYKNHDEFKNMQDKIHPMDFPAFRKREISDVNPAYEFDDNYINLLFCGTLYSKYRSPTFLLDTLKGILLQNSNVRLYFLGTVHVEEASITDERIKKQVFFHAAVSSMVADKTMENADVLINIGNNIHNMIPSKIFDYFSVCKPILNVENLENCPAREYFLKYPLEFTINEKIGFDKNKLEQFILNSKNKKLEYSEVEKTFISATPSYVANQLEALIKK